MLSFHEVSAALYSYKDHSVSAVAGGLQGTVNQLLELLQKRDL